MIRVFLGFVLPALGLGAAVASLAPSLVGAPNGEPMVVASDAASSFEPASFNSGNCAKSLLLGEPSGQTRAGLRVIALAVLSDDDDAGASGEDRAGGDAVTEQTVLLVLDSEGRIVATGSAADLAKDAAIQALGGCEDFSTALPGDV